ncbi:MAG TPA: methyltransferase domain-containing protein [Kofleriaceae bacterium]|nr:methyltransferase domain-containing protein [Kofleriaceae bacterium]
MQYASLHHQRFYEHSGYSNFGYWEAGTRTGRQAADNLVDRLIDKVAPAPAAILDVACGQGGTTARLCRRFPRAQVTAINASERQLTAARPAAPRARFARMDAARLELPDAGFDLVVCVEAAFHFDTREAFLREALRVLRPGGWLVMTDALSRLPRLDALLRRLRLPVLVPAGNHEQLDGYPALLARAGYADVIVEEARAATFEPYARAFLRSCARNLADRALWPRIFFDPIQLPLLAPWLAFHHLWLAAYPLVWARRPETP